MYTIRELGWAGQRGTTFHLTAAFLILGNFCTQTNFNIKLTNPIQTRYVFNKAKIWHIEAESRGEGPAVGPAWMLAWEWHEVAGGGWPDQVCGAAARYANQPPTSPQVPPPTTAATPGHHPVITRGTSHSYYSHLEYRGVHWLHSTSSEYFQWPTW